MATSASHRLKTRLLALLLGMTTSLVMSCGTYVGTPDDSPEPDPTDEPAPAASQPGTVDINLVDAPIDGIRSVFVTPVGIGIWREGAGEDGWTQASIAEPKEVDLLTLQEGLSMALASLKNVPPGRYGRTRLLLSTDVAPRVVDQQGLEHRLHIPSGAESGLIIETTFEVRPGASTELTIDFDVRQSLKRLGSPQTRRQLRETASTNGAASYLLKPRLRLVDRNKAGSLTAAVTDRDSEGDVVCLFAEGTNPDATDDCDTAANSGIVKQGRVRIDHLIPGSYQVRVYDSEGGHEDRGMITITSGQRTETTLATPE